jgi:murein DD-endopeptidase / murein LD-carboxypeptidase
MREIDRARSVIGARFRLHGRNPETGLDCVGLIAFAYDRAAGRAGAIPTGYALRGGSEESHAAMITALRLTRRRWAARAGDMLLMRAGPEQFHLGLWTGDSLIHADAQLRRVVEMPGPPPWPVIGIWHKRKGRS